MSARLLCRAEASLQEVCIFPTGCMLHGHILQKSSGGIELCV